MDSCREGRGGRGAIDCWLAVFAGCSARTRNGAETGGACRDAPSDAACPLARRHGITADTVSVSPALYLTFLPTSSAALPPFLPPAGGRCHQSPRKLTASLQRPYIAAGAQINDVLDHSSEGHLRAVQGDRGCAGTGMAAIFFRPRIVLL
jgi:hypothetical protein